ncbi:hypothetical protein [Planococcus lenghuensis]|uniref:Uncharacterized protein n=1 Tax=Planococcus lenghuensis TaxID=2213202 RepID=A0A1Q2KXR9_9BACL|nr:hypothetical protein [Planococcus lenghuensis]AQQ52607.1 hypothetical protein B0X71_05515 [Planococcus lenghuensis]
MASNVKVLGGSKIHLRPLELADTNILCQALNNDKKMRHHTGKKAKILFQLVTLVHKACRMAADQLKRVNEANKAAA